MHKIRTVYEMYHVVTYKLNSKTSSVHEDGFHFPYPNIQIPTVTMNPMFHFSRLIIFTIKVKVPMVTNSTYVEYNGFNRKTPK